ncbi:MAG: hypothetical protein ACREHV_14465 [Rhizomicrobium sp.]
MSKHKGAPMPGVILAIPMHKPSDKQMVKDHARSAKRNATHDWVAGRITTKEHNAVHSRADHVLSGKNPRGFKGVSGERKSRIGL